MPCVSRRSRNSLLSRNATVSVIDRAAGCRARRLRTLSRGAARKHSGADIVTIITWNLKDFDRKELAKAGVVAENPDAFLCRLLADSPEKAVAAFIQMRDNLRTPP